MVILLFQLDLLCKWNLELCWFIGLMPAFECSHLYTSPGPNIFAMSVGKQFLSTLFGVTLAKYAPPFKT